jgi:DNA-binding transcriptional LysR family regulator
MDRMTSLRVVREVVESGSFVAAAGQLGVSAPMASKHVAQLEKDLGARLLHRSSRHLSLTEAGQAWYEQSRRALDLLDAAEAEIGQKHEAPRGHLKVSAPVWCATSYFAKALADYCERLPEVLVEMHLENRKVDLAADGYDLALRVTQEPSPALIARPLCRLAFHLVATPAYLRRLGTPATPAELASLGAIVPTYVSLDSLSLRGPDGRPSPMRLRPVMKTDDTTLSQHAVLAGIGIAFLPEWAVGEALASGRLVCLLPDYGIAPIPMHAVYTSRQYMAPKLRSFIDFLAERLGSSEKGSQRPRPKREQLSNR